MKITLCGSCKFENEWRFWNELLTLRGHTIFSVAVLPSDKDGEKNWYTDEQKKILDLVHLKKISMSDTIFVITQKQPAKLIAGRGYIGKSTLSEINWARLNGKLVLYDYMFNVAALGRSLAAVQDEI